MSHCVQWLCLVELLIYYSANTAGFYQISKFLQKASHQSPVKQNLFHVSKIFRHDIETKRGVFMKKWIGALLTICCQYSFAQTCEQNFASAIANDAHQCSIPPQGQTSTFSIGSKYLYGTMGAFASCRYYANNQLAGGQDDFVPFCSTVNAAAVRPVNQEERPNNKCGSIVKVQNQTVGEAVPIVGTNITMNYFSFWAQGRVGDYRITVPIAGNSVRDDITAFDVVVKDGSTVLDTASFVNNQTNVAYSYYWNGLDSTNSPTLGTKSFDVTVTEHHTSIDIPIVTTVSIGSLKAKLLGLGGWLPSIFHFYDANTKTLYSGNGSTRNVTAKTWNSTGYLIAEEDGSTVYLFDSTGRQVYEKTSLLGTTINTFNYNSTGQLVSIDQPFSRTVNFNRNSGGNFVSITAPKGQVTAISLNTDGYVSAFTNPNLETYSITYYGAGGLIQTFTKPGSQVSSFSFDSDGNLTQDAHSGGYFFNLVKNISGYNSDYSFVTKMNRVTRYQASVVPDSTSRTTNLPDGRTETYNFSRSSSSASETVSSDGLYEVSNYVNDARFGDQAPFWQNSTTYYGSAGFSFINTQSVTLSDPNDPFSITAYSVQSQKGLFNQITAFNPTTKTFSITTGTGRTSEAVIDAYERVVSKKIGNLYPTLLTYTNENLTKIKQDARETNLAYSSTTGELTSITNPLSQSTAFTYDSAGRVATQILPDLRVIAYGYDANGNLTGVTPPNRPMHAFNFNSSELMNSYAPPAVTGISNVNTTYSYNDDKQLTQITRPTGATITFNYDASTGVLQNYVTSSGTYSIYPDYNNGLPATIVGPGGGVITSMSYAATQPVQYQVYDSSYSFVNRYTANMASNGTIGSDVTATSYGNETISYTYDNDEVLTGAGDETLSYSFPEGLMTGTSIGTGTSIITDHYTYNSFGEVATYSAKYGSNTLYSLTLGRDGMGRVNSKAEFMNAATNNFSYSFDSAGRLTQTTTNTVVTATYGYDDNSNRNSGAIGAQTTIAAYNDQDWMTAYNSLAFTYNANGDMLTRANTITNTTTTYAYDVFGNLTSVTLPGSSTVITYEIDGLNRRFGKLINGVVQKRWIYMDQTRIAAEVDSTGAISKRFVYGTKHNTPDYMIAGGETYRIISDHLGSPRLVIKLSDGSIAQRMNHDEYGRVTEDTNPGYLPFGFAGGLYDEQTSLVRFGSRDYDPETGRWTGKDPIGFGGGDTNLYGYVANDPVNFIDPSGNCPWCLGAVVGGVAAGVATYVANPNASQATIATSAAVGAVAGAASSGLSATASLGVIFGANAGIGYAANVTTQVATGTPLGQINQSSALIAGLAGGVGGIVGLGAGAAAFYYTPVIGNAVGNAAASSARMCTGTLTSATVGTVGGAFGN
jgi:RHS repeat-associated protein